jgi:hypothetical protein
MVLGVAVRPRSESVGFKRQSRGVVLGVGVSPRMTRRGREQRPAFEPLWDLRGGGSQRRERVATRAVDGLPAELSLSPRKLGAWRKWFLECAKLCIVIPFARA